MRYLFVLLFPVLLLAATLEIAFEGNKTFDDQRLLKELGFSQTVWQRVLFKKLHPKVDEKLLPQLLEELELFYQEQGFLHAKIALKKEGKKAIFLIQENSPIKVAYISITSDFPIKQFIPFHKNDRFVIPAFIQMKRKIKEALLNAGYCSATFNPKAYIYKKRNLVYIAIYLAKGDICRIKSVSVQTPPNIPKRVVLSHIFLKPNQTFSLQKVQESYRYLNSLGYFQNVLIDYSKKINNQILLDIKTYPRRHRNIYKAGVGYESDRGFVLDLHYKHLNFHLHQPSFSLLYSDTLQKIELGNFYPSIDVFHTSLDISTTLKLSKERFDSYSLNSKKVRIALLNQNFRTSYEIGAVIQHSKIYNNSSCIPSSNDTLIYPTFHYIFDKRDSKTLPTRGYIVGVEASSSIKALSNSDFFRIDTKANLYFPYKSWQFFAKAELGQLYVASGNVPPSLQFFAGGPNSNRAYGYHKIYALDSDCAIGGNSLLQTTLELRHPLTKSLQGALFWDRTYLSKSHLRFNRYVDGVGIGVLYPTKIGTIKAYVGVDPQNPSHNNLSFFIGEIF